MTSRSYLRRVLVLSSLVAATEAQSSTLLLREGDPVPGGDHLTRVLGSWIDDKGSWLALVDSDRANVTEDALLLGNGAELLREGMALAEPAGSTLDEFASTWRSQDGLSAIYRVRLAFPQINLSGLYHEERLLALEDGPVDAPEVPAGTSWVRFDALKSNGDGTILALGEIANPSVPGPREDALVRFRLDANGALLSTNVVLQEGLPNRVMGGVVTLLGNTEPALAVNKRSDFLTMVMTTAGTGILLNLDTVLARDGAPAPIPGRNYRLLGAFPRVSLNDFGEHAFSAFLDGDPASDTCIVKNGQKFVQEGDLLPAFSAEPVVPLSAAPIYLANSGDLFWLARSTSGEEDAFMRNDQVIVQEGKQVKGHLVTEVALTDNAFHVSPDGRHFIGRVELEGIGDALILTDFGLVVPLYGCQGNSARLRKAGGDARIGTRLTLELDRGQAPGVLPVVAFATRPARPGSECGILIDAGELLVRPSSVFARIVAPPWTGSPARIDVDIPGAMALVDREFFAQGAFLGTGPSATRDLLTNALRLGIGAR